MLSETKGTDSEQLRVMVSWPIGASKSQKHMLKIYQEGMRFVGAGIVFRFQRVGSMISESQIVSRELLFETICLAIA
jgi:hypothetical protein